MPDPQWGTKRVCPTTGKRFFDMNANPVISPYTGQVVNIDTGRNRTMVADAEDVQSKKAAKPEDDDDLLLDDDDEAADADLDDEVLEDDDDDTVSLEELADVATDDE